MDFFSLKSTPDYIQLGDPVLEGLGDATPPVIYLYTFTLGFNWSDGKTSLPSSLSLSGNQRTDLNITLAPATTKTYSSGINFASGITLQVLYVLASYVEDTGLLTMTMTPQDGTTVITTNVSSGIPIVFASSGTNNPTIPDSIQTFTFFNPNSTAATIQVRLMGY